MATAETLPDITIRPMRVEDIDFIATIENSAYFAPWPKAAFHASVGIYPAFVMEKNAQIVGYALFSAVKDQAHIINFVIAPAFQHQGLGRMLLQFILQTLLQNHVSQVTLEVAANNLAAIHLYQAFGFKQAGQRKQYYQTEQGPMDALIFVYKPSYT